MDLREALSAAGTGAGRDAIYRQLLGGTVYVRRPEGEGYHAVTRPETGQRAVPAFVTAGEAQAFWELVTGGGVGNVDGGLVMEPVAFVALAAAVARTLGAVVLDPMGEDLVLDRSELTSLAGAELPGAFGAWLRELDRLNRAPGEVTARLRRTHVHVITTRGTGGAEPRLYLLEKSEDGTLAVPCFSSVETLTQFARVRRLFEGQEDRAVALVPGEYCVKAATGMGAYLLIDPETPWETQVEPTIL